MTSRHHVLLINCDNLVDLNDVETQLFKGSPPQLKVRKEYFDLSTIEVKSKEIVANAERESLDAAIFLVNANESRLSINEAKAGIGYYKIYQALRTATNDKVIIGIAHDDNYTKTHDIISDWAFRRVQAQFKKNYMSGPDGYIFSWNKKPTDAHRRVLWRFLDLAPIPITSICSTTTATKDMSAAFVYPGTCYGDPTPGHRDPISPIKKRTSSKEAPLPKSASFNILLMMSSLVPNMDELARALFPDIDESLVNIHKEEFKKNNVPKKIEFITSWKARTGSCLDLAIFAVHADETRLSINEPTSGIGYTKIYKALQDATDDRVVVAVAMDSRYNDPSVLISQKVYEGIESQFTQEYMIGPKGYVMSWNKSPKAMHSETIRRYIGREELYLPRYSQEVAAKGKSAANDYPSARHGDSFNKKQNRATATGGGSRSLGISHHKASWQTLRESEEVLKALDEYSSAKRAQGLIVQSIIAYMPGNIVDDKFTSSLISRNIITGYPFPEALLSTEKAQAAKKDYNTICIIVNCGNGAFEIEMNDLNEMIKKPVEKKKSGLGKLWEMF